MQQVVDGLEAHQYAELTLEDPPDVEATEGADAVLGTRWSVEVSLQVGVLRRVQERRSPAPGPLAEGFDSSGVVLSDPVLDGFERTPQRVGDVAGGSSLLGEDDGLGATPGSLLGQGLGEFLELFSGMVVGNEHG